MTAILESFNMQMALYSLGGALTVDVGGELYKGGKDFDPTKFLEEHVVDMVVSTVAGGFASQVPFLAGYDRMYVAVGVGAAIAFAGGFVESKVKNT